MASPLELLLRSYQKVPGSVEKLVQYAKSRLPSALASVGDLRPMPGGTGRKVFGLGDELIVKIARMPRGVQENALDEGILNRNIMQAESTLSDVPQDFWNQYVQDLRAQKFARGGLVPGYKYADGGAVAKGLDTPSKNPVGQYIPLYDMRAQRLVDDIKERRDQAEGLQNLKSIRETAGNVGLAAASAYPMARGALAAAPWVGKALTMMRTGVRTPGALGLGAAANVGLGALLDEEGRTPLGAATNAAKGAGYTAFPLGGMTADALVGSDKAEGSPLLDTIKLMRPVAARWVSSNPELQKILHGYGYAKAPSNFNYTNMIGALRQASKEMQMPNALNWQGVRDVGPMTNGAGD